MAEASPARTARIAVVGSANADLITFAERFPRAGETLFGQNFDLDCGGKGANQAVAVRLCGAEVARVAKAGKDLFAEGTLGHCDSFGIDPTHVGMFAAGPAGVAPIFCGGSQACLLLKASRGQSPGAASRERRSR